MTKTNIHIILRKPSREEDQIGYEEIPKYDFSYFVGDEEVTDQSRVPLTLGYVAQDILREIARQSQRQEIDPQYIIESQAGLNPTTACELEELLTHPSSIEEARKHVRTYPCRGRLSVFKKGCKTKVYETNELSQIVREEVIKK